MAATRSTDNKFGGKQGDRIGPFVSNQSNQLADSLSPDPFRRCANCCQRRCKVTGEGNIVETDNCHIVRNDATCALEGSQNANGSIIVTAEDSIEIHTINQHLTDRGRRNGFIELTCRHKGMVKRDIVHLQGFQVAKFAPF